MNRLHACLIPGLLVVLSGWAAPSAAQTIVVSPFLQSPTPTSMWIVWETSTGAESRVEWGNTPSLGSTTMGSAHAGNAGSQIHEVQLVSLRPSTRYHYRVVTGSAASAAFDFVTPPTNESEVTFRIVAMSDMQRDSGNAGKFREIVQDGILTYVGTEFGPDLSSELSLILIPGDLVASGNRYSQWEQHFFDPAAGLFEHVALYPVLGNHEENSRFYFDYFHLPNNGTAGFEEHWYHSDYVNVRIIGLDSNVGYRNMEQLNWLDGVLDDACLADHIDFVFAQLHHPLLSELWRVGETPYTGEVVQRLEEFSTRCGKPSIHLFGHTHGYSRGQSRDHQHLWVNVATAGGNIDYWGEYRQRDYDEFTVSEDEYGFVLLEVTSGPAPTFRLRRISRGDESMTRINELRDDITIRRNNGAPATPTALGPTGDSVPLSCTTLSATPFSDPDMDAHGAAHWQLSTSCTDWAMLAYENWRQNENRYNEVDTQAGDDLTNEEVVFLLPDTDYCFRVRYRDSSLGWSTWSTPLAFHTASGTGPGPEPGDNLLTNPGAEDGVTGWTVTAGFVESITDRQCSGVAPHGGTRCFAVGGVCESADMSSGYQRVGLSAFSTMIDAGEVSLAFGGYLRNFEGRDVPQVELVFRDVADAELGRSERLSSVSASWELVQAVAPVPAMTRSVDFAVIGVRNAGTDNDSYMDDLFLRQTTIGPGGECGVRPPPSMEDAGVRDGGGLDGGGLDSGIDGGAQAGADGGGSGGSTDPDGCGCRLATGREGAPGIVFGLLLTGLVVRRRRGR